MFNENVVYFSAWVERKSGDQGSGQAVADFSGFSVQMPGGGCGEAAQRSQDAAPSVPKAGPAAHFSQPADSGGQGGNKVTLSGEKRAPLRTADFPH